MLEKLFEIYEKDYKKLMVIPMLISIFFGSALLYRYFTTGEFFGADITIKGGTAITFYSNQTLEVSHLSEVAKDVFSTSDVFVRELKDIGGKVIGYDVEVGEELNYTTVLSELGSALGIDLNSSNASVSSQSALIGSSFLTDSIGVIILAFFLMSLVIYYYFRSFIPAFSIIGSTLLDILGIFGVFAILDIKFSVATIGALLMIIGYSTDSDILLGTNIIKRKDGTLMGRIKKAIKTELTMDIAAATTYSIMLVLSNVDIITHIAFVLFISVPFDSINTWILSAGLQRMYVERKK
jgi:preprotein translocase subunit SecF